MKKYFFLFVSAALLISLSASAQDSDYTYNHNVEISGGASFGLYSVAGKTCTARAFAPGRDWNLRYTWFPTKMFGVYAQLGEMSFQASDDQFFSTANIADGGTYRYRFVQTGESYQTAFTPLAMAGVAMRFDFGALSLRPHVGAGYAVYTPDDYSYIRQSRDNTSATYFVKKADMKGQKKNYLVVDATNVNATHNMNAMMLSANLQVVYNTPHSIYLFAELGGYYSPTKMSSTLTVTGSKKQYEPDSWMDEAAFYDLTDLWIADPATQASKTISHSPITSLYFNLGVGINLGK